MANNSKIQNRSTVTESEVREFLATKKHFNTFYPMVKGRIQAIHHYTIMSKFDIVEAIETFTKDYVMVTLWVDEVEVHAVFSNKNDAYSWGYWMRQGFEQGFISFYNDGTLDFSNFQ